MQVLLVYNAARPNECGQNGAGNDASKAPPLTLMRPACTRLARGASSSRWAEYQPSVTWPHGWVRLLGFWSLYPPLQNLKQQLTIRFRGAQPTLGGGKSTGQGPAGKLLGSCREAAGRVLSLRHALMQGRMPGVMTRYPGGTNPQFNPAHLCGFLRLGTHPKTHGGQAPRQATGPQSAGMPLGALRQGPHLDGHGCAVLLRALPAAPAPGPRRVCRRHRLRHSAGQVPRGSSCRGGRAAREAG